MRRAATIARTGEGRRGRRAFGAFATCAALALVLACKGDGGGPVGADPSIAGRWSGSAEYGLVDFHATFTQSGDSVGGSGSFSSPIASSAFSVRGAVQGGNVELVLTSPSIGATTFRGRFVAANRISGTLDRPNDDDLALTLDRE